MAKQTTELTHLADPKGSSTRVRKEPESVRLVRELSVDMDRYSFEIDSLERDIEQVKERREQCRRMRDHWLRFAKEKGYLDA